MSAYGIQIRDAQGGVVFDSADRALRIVDSFVVETASGSKTVPGLGANGFFLTQWMTSWNSSHGSVGPDQPTLNAYKIWQEGDVIRWKFIYDKKYNLWNDDTIRAKINVTAVFYK